MATQHKRSKLSYTRTGKTQTEPWTRPQTYLIICAPSIHGLAFAHTTTYTTNDHHTIVNMVRTRATASAAPLSAAPRRPIKVTPLEKAAVKKSAKATEDEPKPTTRATRGNKAVVEKEEESKTKAAKTATSKTRGRPKKIDTTIEEPELESEKDQPAAKPIERTKRPTRSTRATATTASSAAKEKPSTRATRTTKTSTKEQSVEQAEAEPAPKVNDEAPATKGLPKKKVTFQDAISDDKENQPITTRGGKKIAAKSTKAADTAHGLRAKPVRIPTTGTRSSKRTKDHASDDEEEKPKKKIQRVLTPKKITQIAKAATPDEASEDELSGGKTPIRDLSLSPRRPHTNPTAEAIARTLSPAKKLDFTQPLLQQSTNQPANDGHGPLMSPARRLPTSPAKLFSQGTMKSPVRGPSNENSTTLASPARRPMDSPAKLLFPNATRHDQRVQLSQTATNLFQSPKRSAAFDPARMFAHSAVKPQKPDLSKSTFLSSPAKRTAMFSPLKNSTTPQSTMKSVEQAIPSSDDLDVNETDVTELMNDMAEEVVMSSHQRASVSPMRTYKLSADELQLDFDDSVLLVGSPLKVARSPSKLVAPVQPIPVIGHDDEATELDHEMEDTMPSMQSTPRTTSYHDSVTINPQALGADEDVMNEDLPQDVTMTDEGDDTIILPENMATATPRSVARSYHDNDDSIDELAPSPQEDVVSKYMRTPGTPATIYEHELSNMLSSPESDPQSLLVSATEEIDVEAQSLDSLTENEDIVMGGTPKPATTLTMELDVAQESPISLYENELTVMANTFTPRPIMAQSPGAASTPTSLAVHEPSMMGGTPNSVATPRATSAVEEASPAARAENELSVMAGAFTPKRIKAPSLLVSAVNAQTPVSVAEHELTMMADAFTPRPSLTQTSVASIVEQLCDAQTPACMSVHELTTMADTSPGRVQMEGNEQTPAPVVAQPTTFTPDMPILRKFHMHTVISKIPLKPEAEDSPAKLQIKKRKRPHSLGAQPEFIDISDRTTSAKAARTAESSLAASSRASLTATPIPSSAQRTPASRPSSAKSSRRVVSTPISRTPLTEVAHSNVLAGAVVYIDVKTSEGADASAIYIDLLSSLGGKVSREWKDNLTHVVFKDGNSKVLEKARLSDSDIKVVGVSWPLDCEAQKTWVDETDYLLSLTPTDHILNSVTKSAKRKSMEPSMLVTDGSGSVKRSRSKSLRRSSIKPLANSTPHASLDNDEPPATISTPPADPAKKATDLEKNSLTAAWKSINATSNLGEDTPARRTLELLQKSYELENSSAWDDSLLSSNADTDDAEPHDGENTPRQDQDTVGNDEEDTSLLETGLTPAPYKIAQQMQIGSAPSKAERNGMMSYRERVEEMERREMRDNAFGTDKGAKGVGGKKGGNGKGKRMTVFGGAGAGGLGFEPVRQSPLGR